MDLGSTPGIAHPGPHGASDLAGLGTRLRASDLLSGNLYRPRTVPRNLLSSSELGGAGANHGARQRRSDASCEPIDQRSAGAPTHPAVSRVITTGVSEYEGRRGAA